LKKEKKRKKIKRKKRKKKKAQRVSSNKGEVNILRVEKHFNFKKKFCDFLPLHHAISKILSKIIKKVFLALFGPYFNLAIYMT
jgi:hypothetical protein